MLEFNQTTLTLSGNIKRTVSKLETAAHQTELQTLFKINILVYNLTLFRRKNHYNLLNRTA